MRIDQVLPQPTGEQDTALELMADFLQSDDQQIMSIGGLAGVGKSHLLATAAAILGDEVLVCAPTGNAADVLRKKMRRRDASTVHRARPC
jgi:2-phosphoglycerate kinase